MHVSGVGAKSEESGCACPPPIRTHGADGAHCDGDIFAHDRNVGAGALYRYRLNGQAEHPDPVSRFQPQGVHGPSQVVGNDFGWSDAGWRGLPLQRYVLYELHVGTFTPEGTFDAIIPRIAELKALGVTAIEIMPVAQFPGERNWGYDGVYPLRGAEFLRRPGGIEAARECLPRAGDGGCARRGLQPPGPGRELRVPNSDTTSPRCTKRRGARR